MLLTHTIQGSFIFQQIKGKEPSWLSTQSSQGLVSPFQPWLRAWTCSRQTGSHYSYFWGSVPSLLRPITTNTSPDFVWYYFWGESTAQEEIFQILPLQKAREAGTEPETGRSWEHPALWCGTIISLSGWTHLQTQPGLKSTKNGTEILS